MYRVAVEGFGTRSCHGHQGNTKRSSYTSAVLLIGAARHTRPLFSPRSLFLSLFTYALLLLIHFTNLPYWLKRLDIHHSYSSIIDERTTVLRSLAISNRISIRISKTPKPNPGRRRQAELFTTRRRQIWL